MKSFRLDKLLGNHKRNRKPERKHKYVWEPFESQGYSEPYPKRRDICDAILKARMVWMKGNRVCHYKVRWKLWR